jgi:hypothetical protein
MQCRDWRLSQYIDSGLLQGVSINPKVVKGKELAQYTPLLFQLNGSG